MSDARRDLAAEYALGLLDGDDHAEACARAGTDAAFMKDVRGWAERFEALALEALPDGGAERAPPADVWQAISQRVGAPAPVRRASQGVWFDAGPGASMKMLMVDPPSGRRSALLRLLPGTVFAAHAHDDLEECVVMEGEIEIDGATYGPGDYILAPAGTRHAEIPSRGGALVMLHWSRQ